MKKRKLVFVFLGIVAYLFVGVKQAEFLTNSTAKNPIERTALEKTVTLSIFMSEEDLQEHSALHEQRKEYRVAWEDKKITDKIFFSAIGWIINYFIILIGYTAFFLWQLKWIILGIILLAVYTNFGYWLGNYIYIGSTKKPNIASKFFNILKTEIIWFDWDGSTHNDKPTADRVRITVMLFWPFYTMLAILAWIIFILYKIITAMWWLVKKTI